MIEIPEKIKQQIDDSFNGLEYIGDDETIYFHKNGVPIFANFEGIMGQNDVAFFRDIGNPIFYFIEGSKTTNQYVYEKVKDLLIDIGMPKDEDFYLYVFKPEKDKRHREVFYEILEYGGIN